MGLKDRRVDFIGLGEMKSGTSWVANALLQHNNVSLSFPKELHYFNDRFAYYNPQNPKYSSDLAGYWAHFKHAVDQDLLGEFSVHYLFDPIAAERIHQHFPDVKLIVCYRDPVERAYSQWTWSYYHKKQEQRSFTEVMDTESELIERGLYFKNLQPYLRLFGEENIHLIDLDQIKKEPFAVLRGLEAFLQLSPFPEDIDLSSRNKAKSTKSRLVYRLERSVSENLHRFGLSGLGNAIRRMGIGKILARANSRSTELPPFDPHYHELYDHHFTEDQRQLKQFVLRAGSR